jgi:hypothetical protein
VAQSFSIAPAGAWPLVLLAAVGILVLGVLGGVGRSVLASRTARFEVSDHSLTLHGDWWGRELPRSALRADQARVVDLQNESALQPAGRTFGTGMPGYGSGWFRLRNGERALVYLTDRRRAVVVPTELGYTLILSPLDPEGLVAALQEPRRRAN